MAEVAGLSMGGYEEESGTYKWGYWDKKIKRVLEWLTFKKNICLKIEIYYNN